MKPINQTVWQAANTAERAGRFNRASGGRPSPARERTAGHSDIHQARQGGPRPHVRLEQGPRLHRCIMESQGKRSKSGFTANCLCKIGNGFGSFIFLLWVRLWKWKELCHPQLWSLTGVVTLAWKVMRLVLSVCLSFSGDSFYWKKVLKVRGY